MGSLKQKLPQIGIAPGVPVSYLHFPTRPKSLIRAIRSMDSPQNWQQVSDIFRDDVWTDEVQGVAWDGANWIFSCNPPQGKPGTNHKGLYVFPGAQELGDGKWKSTLAYQDIPHPLAGITDADEHWGQLTFFNGMVFVSHFWVGGPADGQTNVVVFIDSGGFLQFSRWIKLGQVTPPGEAPFYPEFQGINPWDGLLYSCRGGLNPRAFYAHDPQTGAWIPGKVLNFRGGENQAYFVSQNPLQVTICDLPSEVQGACFSPNGHLYVSCDVRLIANSQCKAIACFSALDGYLMHVIPLLAEEDLQELEGMCFGSVSWPDGRSAQIHAILLDNHLIAKDNIFFKSFSADRPELV